MNVKHQSHKTRYKGSITIKQGKLQNPKRNIENTKKPCIKTRTYKHIHNTRYIGYHKLDKQTGGETAEEKAQKKAEKEAAEKQKEEEKKRNVEAKRVLEEEKQKKQQEEKEEAAKKKQEEKEKAAKKKQEEKEKADKKKQEDKERKEKEKAEEKANKDKGKADKKDKNDEGKEEGNANKDEVVKAEEQTGEKQPVKEDVLKLEGEDKTKVGPEKVLKLEESKENKNAPTESIVDEEPTTPTDTSEPEQKPKKEPGWFARQGQSLKKGIAKGASKAWNATIKMAWGDRNTGNIEHAARVMGTMTGILPAYKIVTKTPKGIYKGIKGIYKGAKYLKNRAKIIDIGKLGIPESLRFVKKYNTWNTTRKAATGELKKQKYEEKFAKKQDEMAGYSAEIMKLEAKGEDNLNDEEKAQLKKLRKQYSSAETQLDLISIKNAEWLTKSAKSKANLNKLQASRILPSTKLAINNKIKMQQSVLEKDTAKAELLAKKEVANRVANLDKDKEFQAELAKQQQTINDNLNKELAKEGLTEDQKQKISKQFEEQKTKIAQKLKDEKEKQFWKEKETNLAAQKKTLQTQIYNNQINAVATKLGISIDAQNPQLKALIEQHHADPNAKPLSGEELIKKVSEVGFTNIIANKQTIKEADKYLSAPQAMFQPGDKEAAISTLGNNSAQQSFYKEYVRDARAKLNAKLAAPVAGANNAKNRVALTRLNTKLQTMDKDNRFKGADQDKYFYNLLKTNEDLLGVSTVNKVKEAQNAKQAIAGNKAKFETAVTAYYNARTKSLGPEGLEKLAAIYNPELKADLAPIRKQHYIQVGLEKYRKHIEELLQKNPLALKVENPEIYDKIFNQQNPKPSIANNSVTKMITMQQPSNVQKTNNNKSNTSLNNLTKQDFSNKLFNLYSSIYDLLDKNKAQIFKTYTNIINNGPLESEYNQVIYTKFTTENKKLNTDKIFNELLRETWVNYQNCLTKTDAQKKELIDTNKYTCEFFNDKTREFQEVDIRYIIRNLLMNYYISPFDIPEGKKYNYETFDKINDELLTIIQNLK